MIRSLGIAALLTSSFAFADPCLTSVPPTIWQFIGNSTKISAYTDCRASSPGDCGENNSIFPVCYGPFQLYYCMLNGSTFDPTNIPGAILPSGSQFPSLLVCPESTPSPFPTLSPSPSPNFPTPTATPQPTAIPEPVLPLLDSNILSADVTLSNTGLQIASFDSQILTQNGTSKNNNANASLTAADPVNLSNGFFWHTKTDFKLASITDQTTIELTRTFLARPALRGGDFGPNWFSNYETQLFSAGSSGNIIWIDESGGAWTFQKKPDGSFQPPASLHASFQVNGTTYQVTRKGGRKFLFSKSTTLGPIGKLIYIIDRHGVTVNLNYSANGKLTSVTAPFSGSVQFGRNSSGYISSATRMRDGLSYSYAYNRVGALISVNDFSSHAILYGYASINNLPGKFLNSITDEIGRTTTTTYDSFGRVVHQNAPGGGFRDFTYSTYTNSSGPVIRNTIREIDGSNWVYFFDKNFRLINKQNPEGYSQYFTYTADDQVATATDEKGNVTHFAYDSRGNRTSTLLPGDTVPTTVTYNQMFDLPTFIKPVLESGTTYTLNQKNGDIISISRTAESVTYSTRFTYESFGHVINTDNGLSNFSDQYDSNGHKTYVFDLHNPETRTYDLRGRLSQSIFASGRQLNYTYDDYDRITKILDNTSPMTSFVYDIAGRLIQKSLSDGASSQITKYTWDAHDRMLTETDPLGNITKFTYDSIDANSNPLVFEKPLKITSANGSVTQFAYNWRGLLTQKIDPRGAKINYAYDERGNLFTVTDPVTHAPTSYRWYDVKNQLDQTAELNARSLDNTTDSHYLYTYYNYDEQGRLYDKTRDLAATNDEYTQSSEGFGYNGFGQLDFKTNFYEKADGSGSIGNDDAFTFEPILNSSQIASATNTWSGTITFTHEHSPPYKTIQSSSKITDADSNVKFNDSFIIARDVSGEISLVTNNAGKTLCSAIHDPAGRLTNISSGNYPGILTNALKVNIAYDTFGRKKSTTTNTSPNASYQYDLNNRIKTISWTTPLSTTALVSEALTYDAVGNITAQSREFGNFTYGYDAGDELIKISKVASNITTVQNMTYDLGGNRTSNTTTGSSSFVSNFGINSTGIKYFAETNASGNLETTKFYTDTSTSPNAENDISYYANGRVEEIDRYDSKGAVIFKDYFSYDSLGRRSSKTFTDSKNVDSSVAYIYFDETDSISLSKNTIGATTLYLDGQGVDEHLGQVTSSLATTYITDHLGSVLNTSAGGSGKSFGAFGETSLSKYVISPSDDPVMYGFGGRSFDRETGYYYLRARMYDPDMGRFTALDPLGYAAGDSNLYRYVGNNPLNATDPSGKSPLLITAGIGGIVGGAVGGFIAYANGTSIGQGVAVGATTGFISGLGGGFFASAASIAGASSIGQILSGFIGGAVGGFTGSTVSQAVATGNVNLTSAALSGLSGAAQGAGSAALGISSFGPTVIGDLSVGITALPADIGMSQATSNSCGGK